MFEILQYDYVFRALIASSIVGITCGVLGCFVILRKMALIGDALSHAILPGVVVGFMFFGHNPLAIFIGAVFAGLLTSVVITWIQRNSITKDDASIGIVFTAMFALGIIGISWLTKKEGVHLDMKDFLFGNVLGVSNTDLWLTGMIGLYVLISIILFFKYFFITTFDPLIALTMGISVAIIHYFLMFLLSLTIVASLQSVGVILVVAMLIIPSSTAYLLTNKLKYMLIISSSVGLVSATLGFIIAVVLEITPGPTMTLLAAFFFVLALLFSPKRGFIIRLIQRVRKKYIADQQDILKLIDKLSNNGRIDLDKLKYEFTAYSSFLLKFHLLHLQYHQHLILNKQEILLTASGKHEADTLVRAHRLWESYLVNKMNVPISHIHQAAEDMEHLLPKEFIDKLDKDLGFPTIDPHGSIIPTIKKNNSQLSNMIVGEHGIIVNEQQSGINELWILGILPNSEFVIEEKKLNYVKIRIKNDKFVINKDQADIIKVKY